MPVARIELAAHVNVCQPDNQQNKDPNSRQPDATPNAAMLCWLAVLTERGVDRPATHTKG